MTLFLKMLNFLLEIVQFTAKIATLFSKYSVCFRENFYFTLSHMLILYNYITIIFILCNIYYTILYTYLWAMHLVNLCNILYSGLLLSISRIHTVVYVGVMRIVCVCEYVWVSFVRFLCFFYYINTDILV